MSEHRKPEQGVKLRGAEKVARIPVKVIPTVEVQRKHLTCTKITYRL